MLFWALLASEGEIVDAIEFSNLLSYPILQFWAKETKVVGFLICVAQLLPIWARAFSLNTRSKAIGATDLGSRGTYGIGGLSRKKYAKFSQKACSQPVSQAKR